MTAYDFTVTSSDIGDDINMAVGGELDMLTTANLVLAVGAAAEQRRVS